MVFKISCLLFFKNSLGQILLIQRTKPPNRGLWSPPGGKLILESGESPFECAIRETKEEIGLEVTENDFSLFGYVSEKNYQGNHWLMFLFEYLNPLCKLPPKIDEGGFSFFSRAQIDRLKIPQTDHQLVWPFYDKRFAGFWGVRADCSLNKADLVIEANPAFCNKADSI